MSGGSFGCGGSGRRLLGLGRRIRRRVEPALEDHRRHRRAGAAVVAHVGGGEREGRRRARWSGRPGSESIDRRPGAVSVQRGERRHGVARRADDADALLVERAGCRRCRPAWLPPPSTLPSARDAEPGVVVGACCCGSGARRRRRRDAGLAVLVGGVALDDRGRRSAAPSASKVAPSSEMPEPPVRFAMLLRTTMLTPLPIANPSCCESEPSLPSITRSFESAVSMPFGLKRRSLSRDDGVVARC